MNPLDKLFLSLSCWLLLPSLNVIEENGKRKTQPYHQSRVAQQAPRSLYLEYRVDCIDTYAHTLGSLMIKLHTLSFLHASKCLITVANDVYLIPIIFHESSFLSMPFILKLTHPFWWFISPECVYV